VPETILTDNGTNFVAEVTEELLSHLQCTHITSSPYHPQSNGMVERFHGVLKKVMDKIAKGNSKTQWKELLPSVLMALRTAKHTALGVSPYHLLFGRSSSSTFLSLSSSSICCKVFISKPSKMFFVLRFLRSTAKIMK